MQFKPITAIIVLSLVVASLLVAGCTTSTTSNTNQTPSATPSTATHDAFLEKYLPAVKDSYSTNNTTVKAWEVTWTNSTSAHVQVTWIDKSTNYTWSRDSTYTVFPTTQDATNYLNAMNKTAYSLASTTSPNGTAYAKITGHAPQVYKEYTYNEGNPNNISEYKRHTIAQLDNVVNTHTQKVLYTG